MVPNFTHFNRFYNKDDQNFAACLRASHADQGLNKTDFSRLRGQRVRTRLPPLVPAPATGKPAPHVCMEKTLGIFACATRESKNVSRELEGCGGMKRESVVRRPPGRTPARRTPWSSSISSFLIAEA